MSHVALIPTRYLPGWPEAIPPGLAESALVIIGIPAAIAAVITLFLMGPHWLRQSQSRGQEVERAQ